VIYNANGNKEAGGSEMRRDWVHGEQRVVGFVWGQGFGMVWCGVWVLLLPVLERGHDDDDDDDDDNDASGIGGEGETDGRGWLAGWWHDKTARVRFLETKQGNWCSSVGEPGLLLFQCRSRMFDHVS